MTRLFLFNIETDQHSKYLSSNCDFINSISNNFSQVSVYSTHIGTFSPPKNVSLYELGGGTFFRRVKGVFRCFKILSEILQDRNENVVLYHMVTGVPLLISFPLAKLRVKQAIWYSHSKSSLSLKLILRNVNLVFSPTNTSFPIKTSKLKILGHGVNNKLFQYDSKSKRLGVITVGRVVPIKRIETFFYALDRLDQNTRTLFSKFTIIGDTKADPEYVAQILILAKKSNIDLTIIDQIPREKISTYLNGANYYFMGTPNSLDKAALEAAMCGCILLNENLANYKVFGIQDFFQINESTFNLIYAMEKMGGLNSVDLYNMQIHVANWNSTNNSIEVLTTNISKALCNGE